MAEGDVTMETLDAMEARHKQEVRELEGKIRALMKTAKKSTKVAIETEAIQMQYDLKRQQEEEYDKLIEMGGLSLDDNVAVPSRSSTAVDKPDPAELKRLEDEAIAAKRAKAQKKKEKKVTKEEQRQVLKEEINASAGPSLRELEIAQITAALLKENLCIKEIASDGHCLYR
jgi:OTU domain-containing protein 6